MSASSIPNLLSLRGRGGARGGRGGRNRGGMSSSQAQDATIQGTDTDAAVSRLSAVDMGYMDDSYAQYFLQADGPPTRRFPIINRGTYTRTTALNTLVEAFLQQEDGQTTSHPRQIISLGAGTDTRPFHLFTQPNHQGLVYHEIDFEVISAKKLRTVRNSPKLSSILTNATQEESGTSWTAQPVNGGEYYCHGLDLRQFADSDRQEPIVIPGLRTEIPTLILSECCLCYLSPTEATQTLDYFISKIPHLATIIYEPIRPDDAFGQIMVSNLAARKIRMPTLEVYQQGKDQEERLSKAGFEMVKHMTVEKIWEKWVQPEEKERVDGLEGLDEVEEWKLLASHYVVVWGAKGDGFGAWAPFGGGA